MDTITPYKGQEHIFALRVYYEDTDAGGIVYHSNYLNFAERARTEMLRDMGFEHAQLLATQGIVFTVRQLEISYKTPARLDDALQVKTRITDMSGARFSMEQEITKDAAVLADIKLSIACIDEQGRATRLPEDFRQLFAA